MVLRDTIEGDYQMITIGGVDYSEYIDTTSVNCFKKKTTMDDINVELHASESLPISVGMELLFDIDGAVEFGGIIQSISGDHFYNYVTYSISATSYEQITDRRTVTVDSTGVTAGSIVQTQADTLASEGITVGNIDDGAIVTYAKNAVSIKDILNDMATASGFVWFITNDKKLYFQSDYNYTDGVALPDDYALTKSTKTLKSYYNKVFVLGASDEDGNQVLGIASDTAEQSRMGALFGSGVYGTIVRSSSTSTDVAANELATKELTRRSYERDGITIESRTRLVVGSYYLGISIPEAFISNQDYVIDEVTIIAKGTQYIYRATLVAYSTAIVAYDERWQEKFKQFMNINNESTAVNASLILTQRVRVEDSINYDFLPTYTTSITDSSTTSMQAPTPLGLTDSFDYATLLNTYLTSISDTTTHIVS